MKCQTKKTAPVNLENTLNALYPAYKDIYKWLEIYTQDIQTIKYSSLDNGMSSLLCIIPIDKPSWA